MRLHFPNGAREFATGRLKSTNERIRITELLPTWTIVCVLIGIHGVCGRAFYQWHNTRCYYELSCHCLPNNLSTRRKTRPICFPGPVLNYFEDILWAFASIAISPLFLCNRGIGYTDNCLRVEWNFIFVTISNVCICLIFYYFLM